MRPGHTGDLSERPGAAGRELRYARRAAGFTQRELAARTGRQQATIGRIEAGLTQPRFETVLLLVNACGFELTLAPRAGNGVDRSALAAPDPAATEARLDTAATEARNLEALLADVSR